MPNQEPPVWSDRKEFTGPTAVAPMSSPAGIAAGIKQRRKGRRTVGVRHESDPRGPEQFQPYYVKVEISAADPDEALDLLAKAYTEAEGQLVAFRTANS